MNYPAAGPLDSSPYGWFSGLLHRAPGSGGVEAAKRDRYLVPLRGTRYLPAYSSGSSVADDSSGGTVIFSGVTSPGMKVMSTSSAAPSAPALRPTRTVEPSSSWRPST